MSDLSGLRVLVAEDEYLIAMWLETVLTRAGCHVVGPVARVADALPLAQQEELNGAILDIRLQDGLAFRVADRLLARGVPVIFATGQGMAARVPKRLRQVTRLDKPYGETTLMDAVRREFTRP